MDNTEAFRDLFLRFYSPLCGYASRFVSRDNAEELVQDLMLRIWEARGSLILDGSLKSYLFAAVRNRAFNAIQKQKYQQEVRSRIYERVREKFDNPDYYMADDLAEKIRQAVAQLPESYRETFEMSRFGELTNARIAQELNVSVKTVEYRISRSLRILRVKLKGHLPVLTLLFC